MDGDSHGLQWQSQLLSYPGHQRVHLLLKQTNVHTQLNGLSVLCMLVALLSFALLWAIWGILWAWICTFALTARFMNVRLFLASCFCRGWWLHMGHIAFKLLLWRLSEIGRCGVVYLGGVGYAILSSAQQKQI